MHFGIFQFNFEFLAKKMKDSLSSFLPGLPGMVDISAQQDNSSLKQLILKPPVGGKELMLLNQLQLAGFRCWTISYWMEKCL